MKVDDLQRQELSCTNVIPIIQYMETVCGSEHARQAVESIGLPLSFLRQKSNWVSYAYYNKLLDSLVEETGDEMAPYRAPLSIKPQEVFEYALYATQALLWYGGLRLPYRLILGSDLYRRWTKIGRFEIVSSRSRSMEVNLTLDDGYDQTRHNCSAVQGMLASIPVGIGLPPAEVEEIHCAADGHENCAYRVTWQNPRRTIGTFTIPIAVLIVVLQLTVFRNLVGFKDAVISALALAGTGFLVRNLRFRKSLREQERVNRDRNAYLVRNLEKVEEDYKELLDTKVALQERSEYLTIIGQVGEAVRREFTKASLLQTVYRILMDSLRFRRGDFFQYDSGAKRFVSTFGALYEIPESHYQLPENGRFFYSESELGRDNALIEWSASGQARDGTTVQVLPVETADLRSGFYAFSSSSVDGMSTVLIGTLFRNVADQLRVGLAKIRSRTVIDDILSSIPEYVLIFSSESFLVRYANTHFYRSASKLGIEEGDDITDAPIFTVLEVLDETEKTIRSAVQTLGINEKSDLFETVIGDLVYEYNIFSIPRSADGEQLAGIILSDVTEAKSFQAKMLTSEKLLALGRVAGGIAHEINNPLYAVLANAEEIIDDAKAAPETIELAEEITTHVMNISSVVQDLSTYSRTMRKENIDLIDINEVIHESLKLVEYGSNLMEIETKADLDSLPPVLAVRGEIQQIFINLFTNAIWAMHQSGTLSISSRAVSGEVEVRIGDTGIGIPESELPNIFNYLYTTKAVGEGTGQGLSIVKRLAEQNGGAISVESTVGVGTTFTLSFPVSERGDG